MSLTLSALLGYRPGRSPEAADDNAQAQHIARAHKCTKWHANKMKFMREFPELSKQRPPIIVYGSYVLIDTGRGQTVNAYRPAMALPRYVCTCMYVQYLLILHDAKLMTAL